MLKSPVFLVNLMIGVMTARLARSFIHSKKRSIIVSFLTDPSVDTKMLPVLATCLVVWCWTRVCNSLTRCQNYTDSNNWFWRF